MLHAAYSVQDNVEDVEDIKTSHNRFLTDFLEFISSLSKMSKMYVYELQCRSYKKTSNYSKVRFKALIYFGLEQTLN